MLRTTVKSDAHQGLPGDLDYEDNRLHKQSGMASVFYARSLKLLPIFVIIVLLIYIARHPADQCDCSLDCPSVVCPSTPAPAPAPLSLPVIPEPVPAPVASDVDPLMKEFVSNVLLRTAKQVQSHSRWDEVTSDTNAAVPFLEKYIPTDAKVSILEVGTGQNQVAQKLKDRASAIYSITISQEEVDRANALGIPHYKTLLHNKHSLIPESFIPNESLDYVLDVNVGSFSKIWQWNAFLLLKKLKIGGKLVCQQIGMAYTMPHVGSASVTKDMLVAHESVLGYKVEDFSTYQGQQFGVFILTKVSREGSDLAPLHLI
eukprot:TRINITY_DN23353_c0_g1_i1.p1 TRINITY_DN23353_c0_g1~~TRINITY_DN23353_c0_g1_i1.p1  ORF type:complete len:316 (+),score=55.96 TRINITY_DN23353_c0_g1_i1:72-1019(+)